MEFDKHKVAAALASPTRLAALSASGLMDSPQEEGYDVLTQLACELLNTPAALITLVDQDRQFIKSQQGLAQPWAQLRETPIDYSFCKYAVASREPLVVEDARLHEVLKEHEGIDKLHIRAYAGIPLISSQNEALGVLCAFDSEPRPFTPLQLKLLGELANLATRGIELSLANSALARSEARLRAINERSPVGIFLLSDANSTIEHANLCGCQMFGYTLEELRGQPLAHFVHPEEPFRASEILTLWTGAVEEIDRQQRFLRRDRSLLWGRVHAALVHGHGGDFAVAIVEDITRQKEYEARLAQQAEELKALSVTDPLTGLLNRRGFLMMGEQMIRLAQRQSTPLLLLFYDLDGLKTVNDQLGHAQGDQFIGTFARVLQRTFRQTDVVGRIGGDEMVVLAQEHVLGNCGPLLARFQEALRQPEVTKDLPFPLAASVGVTWFDPTRPQTLEELLRQADLAMYEDKRNRKATR